MSNAARVAAATLALALVLAPARASAEDCTDSPAVARARAHLQAEAPRAQVWNGGWTALFVTSAVGAFSIASLVDSPGQKASLYWTSAKSTIATIFHLRRPIDVPTLPPCADEAQARQALERAAKSQRRGRHWMRHAEGAFLNLIGIAILGFGYGYWTEALVNTALGTVVGEIRIFTQPTGSTRFSIEVTPVVLGGGDGAGAGILVRF